MRRAKNNLIRTFVCSALPGLIRRQHPLGRMVIDQVSAFVSNAAHLSPSEVKSMPLTGLDLINICLGPVARQLPAASV